MNSITLTLFTLTSLLLPLASASAFDDGLSPIERNNKGYKIFGVYDVQNRLYCSQKARQKYTPETLPSLYVLTTLKKTQQHLTVGQQTKYINQILHPVMQKLKSFKDPKVQSKHICTGFYVDHKSQSGNAKSMGLGYLLFDYKLIQKLYALPDHKRSFWVYHFLIYHEFAHQLQFWNNDIEVRKTLKRMQNSKTPELAADCVAGALLRLLNLNLNDTIFETSFKGVLGATEALGDFHRTSYSHHGTPLERTLAASFGSGFINKNKKLIQQNRFHISSGHLIHTCNQFVKKHLK